MGLCITEMFRKLRSFVNYKAKIIVDFCSPYQHSVPIHFDPTLKNIVTTSGNNTTEQQNLIEACKTIQIPLRC